MSPACLMGGAQKICPTLPLSPAAVRRDAPIWASRTRANETWRRSSYTPTTGSRRPQTETSEGRSCIRVSKLLKPNSKRKPSTSALGVRSARLHALLSHQHSSALTVTDTATPESGSTGVLGAVQVQTDSKQ